MFTVLLAAALGIFFHAYRLDTLPRGLYLDECSVGYNALRIAEDGVDEHGRHWPLFFEAFGEYKNGPFIYLTAAVYKLAGISEYTTRLPYFLCWIAGAAGLFALARRIWPDGAVIQLYFVIALSFTPWIFALGRFAPDMICQLPCLALFLYAVYRAYEQDDGIWISVAGVAIGISLYVYSTSRLLAPAFGALVLANYPQRRYWRRHLGYILTSLLTTQPYVSYFLQHPDRLTGRFIAVTYLGSLRPGSHWDKFLMFADRYFEYLGPKFLLTTGDPFVRQHTGWTGELFWVTGILLVVAAGFLIKTRALWAKSFPRYLVVALLISPAAAALTNEHFHSGRAFTMLPFLLILSGYGLHALLHRPLFVRAALCVLFIESALYTRDYFITYPEKTRIAFENYGFKQALERALASRPQRVMFADQVTAPYITLLFFGRMLHANVPLLVGDNPQPGDAWIFPFRPNAAYPPSTHEGLPPDSLFGVRLPESRPVPGPPSADRAQL